MPGGVCATLDYEVDLMAEYVAEMATRLVTPDSSVSSPFRKFVSQILTSTRLPSTTILLGMNYLAKRINGIKGQQQDRYKATEGQVWRYLTVSLLLGSKFLDDNTFQNRSWSEVSGIPVTELNSLEYDWVQAMSWRLYVNLDVSKDYRAWLDSWRDYQDMRKRQQAAQVSREKLVSQLPAIDTQLSRYKTNRIPSQSQYIQRQIAAFERYQTRDSQQHYHHSRDAPWPHNPWNPPTPPDSGYGTPDYVMSTTISNSCYNDWFSNAATQCTNQYTPSASSNQYCANQTSEYSSFYPLYAWDGMGDCHGPGLAPSMKYNSPYFVNPAFGQPVAG